MIPTCRMASAFFSIVALSVCSALYGRCVHGSTPGRIAKQFCTILVWRNVSLCIEQCLVIIWQTAFWCLASKWSCLRVSSEYFAFFSSVARGCACRNFCGSLFLLLVVRSSCTTPSASSVVSNLLIRSVRMINDDAATIAIRIWPVSFSKLAISSQNIFSFVLRDSNFADQHLLVKRFWLQLYDYQTIELCMDQNPDVALQRNFNCGRGSDQ